MGFVVPFRVAGDADLPVVPLHPLQPPIEQLHAGVLLAVGGGGGGGDGAGGGGGGGGGGA